MAVTELAGDGADPGASTLAELVAALPIPRTVWVMVPAGSITQSVVDELLGLLESGDCLIDGGNSYYRDDIRRSKVAAEKGIDYLDVGTSGGVWGKDRGFCLMIGGADRAVDRLTVVGHDRPRGRYRSAHPAEAATRLPRNAAGCTAVQRRGSLRQDGS